MPIGRRLTAFTAIAALVGAFACSSDSATSPGQPVPDSEIDQAIASDVGESFADAVGQFDENESFEASLSGGSSTFAAQGDAGTLSRTVTCGGPDGDGWYGCIAYTERGLTITRQVRFWSGGALALGWDAATTDSVNHRWTRTGTVNSAVKQGKVRKLDDADTASMVVERGTTVLHVWNGAGARIDSSSYTVHGVTRLFAYTAHDTAAALAFTVPRSQHPYPASGSISRNLELHFTAGGFDKTITRSAKVTFDGTSVAELQVGDLTCDLDLATWVVSNCH